MCKRVLFLFSTILTSKFELFHHVRGAIWKIVLFKKTMSVSSNNFDPHGEKRHSAYFSRSKLRKSGVEATEMVCAPLRTKSRKKDLKPEILIWRRSIFLKLKQSWIISNLEKKKKVKKLTCTHSTIPQIFQIFQILSFHLTKTFDDRWWS